MSLTLYPPAKINLGLMITGRRADGYHLLQTAMLPIADFQDVITFHPAEQLGLHLAGIPLAGKLEDNLCIRAYHLLKDLVPTLPPVFIHLRKGIPAGAGLGGGSSDAAYTLRGLNEFFQLGLANNDLYPIAAKLGADVSFFLQGDPALATGVGEVIRPIAIPQLDGYRIDIQLSELHSDTATAYRNLTPENYSGEVDLAAILAQPIETWRENLKNDLEAPVFARYSELAETKARLYAEGAIYAAMSGSGSAVFGIFKG
jgi:4-diphosphocytidyl-2-C-methyl-D-erythritol kinase